MKTTAVFYQAEGLRDIGNVEVGHDATFAQIREQLVQKHSLQPEVLIFLENAEEPIDALAVVTQHAGHAGVKVHLHRCKHVGVSVTFNGETVHDDFSPATTIARTKHWAAVRKFGMNEEEAGEHVLQITGTTERPAPGTHLGSLVTHPKCRLAFDLVPDQRVNGHAGVCK